MDKHSRFFPAGATIVVLAIAIAGCSRGVSSLPSAKNPATQTGPGLADISVRSSPVAFGPLAALHRASGTVKPVLQSQVASQVGGVVSKVLLKAGDWAAEGGAVIQLDDSQLQLSAKTAEAALEAAKINLSTLQGTTSQASPRLDFQVRSAEAALSAAQRNYESKKALLAQGGATNADLDQANSAYQSAQANLEAAKTALDQNQKADVQDIAQLKLSVEQADYALQQARLNLAHASIRAPYAGRIVSVNLMPGEFVGPDAPAFVIASQEREIDFSVPPSDAGSLSIGTEVDFTLNGEARRLSLSRSPNVPVNGVVPFVAYVPSSMALPFGAVGTVSYTLVLARGTIIPTGAIQTTEDRNYAFAIENSKAVERPITILAESGDTAAVAGVEPGSMVIVNPPPGLMDGSAVKAIPVAPVDGSK
jgi:multidrug efflux pump subunit AcrA (membrane-fusion protein)